MFLINNRLIYINFCIVLMLIGIAQCKKGASVVFPYASPQRTNIPKQAVPNAISYFEAGKSGLLQLTGLGLESTPDAIKGSKTLFGKVLSPNEIPPLGDIVNVTKNIAYRLLPHGKHFNVPARLRITYNPSLIPEGKSAADIRGYYYDTKQAGWVELPLDTILQNEQVLVCKTDHFTDFIAGIIQSPELEKTSNFEQNAIKDLKAGAVGTNMDLIEIPAANPNGVSKLTMPLRLPMPRDGVGPGQLAFDYASGSGNNWMGLDWDFSLPFITLDTRWGAPRYRTDVETETYLFNGLQLYPVAHRGWFPRSVEKQFYQRIEGQFMRIIRHGNSPKNYWWELTDKSGTRYLYGGGGDGVDVSTVLSDDQGNIAHWALREIRDANDNFCRFTYSKVQDVGMTKGKVAGFQLYPNAILYTGHGGKGGVYAVRFIRDRQLNEPRRADVEINCRLGFKRVTADLLRHVHVYYQDQLIRSYELKYRTGVFFKTLLQAIVVKDRDGAEFYKHEFDYYDDLRKGMNYVPYGKEKPWEVPFDNVTGEVKNQDKDYNGNASLLSTAKSKFSSWVAALTAGWNDGNMSGKSNTLGGNYGESETSNEGIATLIDIDGDALPDKVFKQSGRLFYRKNLVGKFGEKRDIKGIQDFNRSVTEGSTSGFEAHPFVVFIGTQDSESETTITTYFSDFNGDGLIDIAHDSKVYFNRLDVQGNPEFLPTSIGTPNPVANFILNTNLFQIDPAKQQQLIDKHPPHDVVRIWEAPYDGTVSIEAPVELIKDPVGTQDPKADGVRVSVQQKDVKLTDFKINANDYSTKNIAFSGLKVKKGQRIYFRLQSVLNGKYDEVKWDPIVRYENLPANELDANGRRIAYFRASEDYLLASPQIFSLPLKGRIKIVGNFSKPTTSDDVWTEVLRVRGKDTLAVYRKNFAWNQTANQAIVLDNVQVDSADALMFRARGATNIDWSLLNWMPAFHYTVIDKGIPAFDPQGNPVLSICPAVGFSMYNEVKKRTPIKTTTQAGALSVSPALPFKLPWNIKGYVTFSVKGINKLHGRDSFYVGQGKIFPNNIVIKAQVSAKEPIYVEYHVANPILADSLFSFGVPKANWSLNGSNETVDAGLFAGRPLEELLFGPLYRGWGQFVYNGNRDRADKPIFETDLSLDSAFLAQQANQIKNINDPSGLGGIADPADAKFILMISDPKTGTWRGMDNLTFLGKDCVSSSRLGKDDILLINPINPATGANAPFKISQNESSGVAGSFSLPIPIISLGLSANQSDGKSKSILDILDLNGDRIPDPVSEKSAQYSQPTGALDQHIIAISLGSHAGESDAWGYSGGGGLGYSEPKQSNSGPQSGPGAVKVSTCTMSNNDRAGNNSGDAGKTANASAGVSINVGAGRGGGSDQTTFTLIDLNGDGLPDRLFEKDTIALNLGYRFAGKEIWGQAFIREGKNRDYSSNVGLGFNIGGGSIQGGIGYSNTQSQATKALHDVNNDGLLDALIPGNPMTVQFNTGNGFAPAVAWPGVVILDEGASIGESSNFGGTGCFPVFFGIFKICFNSGGGSGNSISRQLNQFMDVDGDGFSDWLSSESDGELLVKKSTIARTNLLKTVHRPLGASFVLDYQRQPNIYNMPHPIWRLESVQFNDGLSGDGPDWTTTTFEYEDGYYDRREREFYGFRKVTTTELDEQNQTYRKTIQVYANRQYHNKGLLQQELVTDAQGRVFHETLNQYELRDITTGAALPANFDPNADAAAFPALSQTWQYAREGHSTLFLQTSQTYQYDPHGNVVAYNDLGDSTPEDGVQANVQYHFLSNPYIFSAKSITVSTNSGIARKRESSIDNKGNVTQIRQYIGSSDPAVLDLEYYANGNLKKATRPKNHRGERLTYEYEYDPIAQIYATKIKDGYGYEAFSQYDLMFGERTESTDINGNKMRRSLDPQGRLATITGPYEIKAGKPYTIAFDYYPNATVPYARTRHYDPELGKDIETYTFSDGLMRPVQVKKTGSFFAGDGKPDEVGMIVSGRILFDAFGRTLKTWFPVREAKGKESTFNTTFDMEKPSETVYDLLNRPLQQTLPDGAKTLTEYELVNDNSGKLCLRATITDPQNNIKEQYTDARGRKRAEKDNGPNGDIWTDYRYNGLSELLKVTDDAGNETTYTYDWLGRKLSVNHPDMGLTEWQYDPAGNMVAKITAEIRLRIPNDGAIRYTYDHERLVQVDYPKNFHHQIKYTYGEPKAPFNRAGRIVLTEDATGGQEFYYGPLGEHAKTIRTVLVSKAVVLNFITEYEHDTWNRIQKIIYPDGEKVDYQYNAAGKLHRMNGVKLDSTYRYVDQLGYDTFEQRVFLRYGNGTTTEYKYDPKRRRLDHMGVTLPSGRRIMDNQYEYDAVSNVLSVENVAPRIEQYQLGGPVKHQYEYDELYRLTKAEGIFTGFNRQERYHLRMEYSNTHDILRKTQTHWRDSVVVPHTTYDHVYDYSSTAPHAPTTIGRLEYGYNANGNQTGWKDRHSFQSRHIMWDEDNLPMAIWDNGYLSRRTRDAAGDCILKSHGPVEASFIDGAPAAFMPHSDNYAAYPSPYITARRDGFVKHYFVDGQRITSKYGSGKFDNPVLPAHQFVTAGKKDYAKRMQQLEDAALNYYVSIGATPDYPTLPGFDQQPEFTGSSIPALSTGAYTLAPKGYPNLPEGRPDPNGSPGHPVWAEKPVPHDSLKAGFNFTGEHLNSKFMHEHNIYFFHPDHLGSTGYVTGRNGEIRQHLEYMPFGEPFVDEYLPDVLQPWRFNGKEYDARLELTDFGARQLDNRLSVWISPDPLAEKYPGWSPYNFGLNNPVKYVDPDGRAPSQGAFLKASEKLGVDINKIKAVFMAETGGNSFLKDGRVKILWERHYFSKFTGGNYDASHPNLSNPKSIYEDKGAKYGSFSLQHDKLNTAISLDEEKAYSSASYGGFQIMGSNYKEAGYSSAKEFALDMLSGDEDKHLNSFVNFIQSNPKLDKALKDGDWTKFAKNYNGPSYKKGPSGPYDQMIKKEYEKLSGKTHKVVIEFEPLIIEVKRPQ